MTIILKRKIEEIDLSTLNRFMVKMQELNKSKSVKIEQVFKFMYREKFKYYKNKNNPKTEKETSDFVTKVFFKYRLVISSYIKY